MLVYDIVCLISLEQDVEEEEEEKEGRKEKGERNAGREGEARERKKEINKSDGVQTSDAFWRYARVLVSE